MQEGLYFLRVCMEIAADIIERVGNQSNPQKRSRQDSHRVISEFHKTDSRRCTIYISFVALRLGRRMSRFPLLYLLSRAENLA